MSPNQLRHFARTFRCVPLNETNPEKHGFDRSREARLSRTAMPTFRGSVTHRPTIIWKMLSWNIDVTRKMLWTSWQWLLHFCNHSSVWKSPTPCISVKLIRKMSPSTEVECKIVFMEHNAKNTCTIVISGKEQNLNKRMLKFGISIIFQYFVYIWAKINTFSRSWEPISQSNTPLILSIPASAQFNTFNTAREPWLTRLLRMRRCPSHKTHDSKTNIWMHPFPHVDAAAVSTKREVTA